jgi:hypothetical protein
MHALSVNAVMMQRLIACCDAGSRCEVLFTRGLFSFNNHQ